MYNIERSSFQFLCYFVNAYVLVSLCIVEKYTLWWDFVFCGKDPSSFSVSFIHKIYLCFWQKKKNICIDSKAKINPIRILLFFSANPFFFFPFLIIEQPFMAKPLGTFHGQTFRTLHRDPNLRVLTALQQPVPSKFKISSVAGFKSRTMCHLLGPHFPVFSLTN